MMSVSPIAGDAGYYASQDNYYVLGSLESRWEGKGAEALGLSGHVIDAELNAMRKGVLPDGTLLSRVENGKETHRPGYDLTFSAPKSVSMMALIGGDRRFIDAHNRAVDTVMKEVEALASARITEGGQTQTVLTGNIVAALYNHDTSRDLDPQLHTHALVFNATEADGKWRALASDTKMKTGFSETMYANQVALGNIYRHALRQDIESMGFDTVNTGKNGLWEIKDVPVEPFSQRSQAINAAAGEGASLKSRDIAALDTRKAKVASDPVVLVAQWNQRLKETGFNLPDFVGRAKARELRGTETPEPAASAVDMAGAISTAISTLSENKVQFTYSELLAKTASQLPAEPGLFAQVREGIDTAIEHQRLIPLDKEKGIFTSDVHLLNELSVHQLAKTAMQENRVLSFPDRAVERPRSYGDAYSVLSQDNAPVAILSGRGGAAQLRERIADAAIMAGEKGRDITIIAADNRGRDYLSQEPLLTGKVMSRSALTADLTLPPQSTVVIAQAEKLSLKETLLILEKGQQQGVQMLFIDSENRTGTGNALSVLKDAGVPQYKSYDSQKIPTTVVSEGDKRQRYDLLAHDYAALKAGGQPVVAQASGPREQTLLNTAIRTELQATGQLGKDERQVSVIHPVWLDGKTRNQRDSYRAGMVMEQWDRETKTMSRYSIDRVAESTNTLRLVSETGDVRVEKISGLDSSWSAYTNKTLPVATGEPLMAVGRELEGKIKARDGLIVTGFVGGGVVVSKGDTSLVLDTSRALKLASPLVEGLGASVGDNKTVLVAAGLRDMNGAALNQVVRSGNKAMLYTALPQDRAEKRLSSHPNFRVASEQVKGVAGELNLDAAMLKNRDALRTPVAQSVALGLSRAQSQSIAFSKVNLISASLGWSPDVTVSQVDAEVDRQVKNGDLIALSPVTGAGSGLIVPRVTYEMEKSIIRTVAEGKNAVAPLMERVPEKHLAGLTGGQQAATKLILESPDRFVAIQGYAGTGKTTQFKAVMAVLDSLPASQRPGVIGLAPTHRAVHEMQSVGVRSQTLSSFLSEERQKAMAGEKTDYGNTLFLVDESSMVGNRDMAELYQRVAATGGRAISSGDVAQLQSIEPGQPFRLVQQRSAIDTAVMQDIVRQTPELRPAIYSMIEGNPREALEKVEAVTPAQIFRKTDAWAPSSSVMEIKSAKEDEKEAAVQGNDPADVIDAITRDFAGRTPQTQAQTLVVAHLNADRHAINRHIHDALHKNGEVGKSELTLTVLEPARVPDKALRSAAGFIDHIGHVAVMDNRHMTVSGVDTAQGMVTLTDDTGKPTVISNFENSTQDISLYVPRDITVSPGDRMRFTRSDNERGYVANSQWQVSRLENSGRITLSSGEQKRVLEPARLPEDGHIDLAYAVTAHGAQGASERYVITLEGTEGGRKRMATREAGYVTLSRAKEHVQVYTDDREGWLKQLDRQSERHSAHDLLHHDTDRSALVAEKLLSTGTPLQDTPLGRKLLQTSGLDAGESMAKFIAPGKKYPQPHIALPVWDSNGRRAGIYLDEVRFMPQGGGAWLSNEPRIMGSDDARFAGLQASRTGDTHVAGSIHEGQVLAHQYPDSGVLVRLSGEGTPRNLPRITGTTLAIDAETLRQALPSDGEPLPFIPMHDEKQQAALEKVLHAAAARPEDEKLRLAAEAARAGLAKSGPEPDEKTLSEAAGKRADLADLTADPAVMQIAAQERAATRLQQMERDIVIEKTLGE
ncbi:MULTISPECIES: conjugative transfer relaxase/helicase TraI [Rahnella]|uniref:Conjugative transfer relaxase/helicase TraI n=1 Tax=Rahnella laticis TaxID=2787622 RepID=A0ABS0EB92_9GAMM|nr:MULTISPECIES: conjugative transfer relaxase/helicase TraI [Rahnella]MBF7982116.1 conjugative transfer relaxase/helicase TraI [Rahnella laticis]MBF8002206.1 conjugative transfer relaxase/helicase TraI [Rahnella sp. LAC-M12]